MLSDALIVRLSARKTHGNSHLKPVFHGACFEADSAPILYAPYTRRVKPPFHGACFGAVSAPTLSARVPRRARAAFEKERFHYEHSSCFHGADCRAD